MTAPNANSSSAESLARINLLDSICDNFEAAWKDGEEPDIEQYLSDVDDGHARELFEELVHVDMFYRRRNGEESSIDDYIQRYPQYSSNLTLPRPTTAAGTKPAEQVPTTRHIGEYELRDQVGAGSFGTVWRAWHPKLHRMDAIKLPQHGINDHEQMDVLHHEARAAAKLNHPNVVRVIGFGEWSQRPYIVFEFIEGITLRQWGKKEKPTHHSATELLIKLADGIHHAHELNIIHRDLKPQNILIDESGEPHITDFGMAKRLDIHSTIAVDGVIMGTVPYMSPEQVAADHENIEAASDIYSLGVILYELLTGCLPFQGSRAKMMHLIQFEDPPPLRRRDPSIPVDLETICLQALQKSPADRYTNAAEFRDDLRRALAGQPIRARRKSVVRRAANWIRQRPVAVMGLLLAITGMLLIAELVPPAETATTAAITPETDPEVARVIPNAGELKREVLIETLPEGGRFDLFPYDPDQPWLPVDPLFEDQQTPITLELSPGMYRIFAEKDDLVCESTQTVPDDGSQFHWPQFQLQTPEAAGFPTR